MSSLATVMAVLLGVLFTTRYLQRGQTPSDSDVDRALADVKERIAELKSRAVGPAFTDEDKEALMQTMHERIRGETAGALLMAVESRVAEKYGDRQILDLVTGQAGHTLDRLRRELFALSRRGNLNLSIGIVTTITGLALLGMFVLQDIPASTDISSFIVGFLPRISLVLLIEIFAYFFLRLYKSTLSEIKYFQNEITSIEAKFLALTVAATGKKEDQLKNVLEHLATTERNFILDKGQTTIDLERSRLEQRFDQALIERLADVVKKRT